jgi:hypothetical protein
MPKLMVKWFAQMLLWSNDTFQFAVAIQELLRNVSLQYEQGFRLFASYLILAPRLGSREEWASVPTATRSLGCRGTK